MDQAHVAIVMLYYYIECFFVAVVAAEGYFGYGVTICISVLFPGLVPVLASALIVLIYT